MLGLNNFLIEETILIKIGKMISLMAQKLSNGNLLEDNPDWLNRKILILPEI